MFRHVVLFTWKAGATEGQKQTLTAELLKLPSVIREIRDYHVGPDAGVNAGNYDYAVVAEFDDVAGYLVYRDHPDHRAVITQYLQPILAQRAAVQFEG